MQKPLWSILLVFSILLAAQPVPAQPVFEQAQRVPFVIETIQYINAFEGQLITMVFSIKNRDDQPHVIYDLRRTEYPWTVYTFQRMAEGSLEVDREKGAYRYDPNAEGHTERFFTEGLIWPGQSISLKVVYRPLQSKEEFEIR